MMWQMKIVRPPEVDRPLSDSLISQNCCQQSQSVGTASSGGIVFAKVVVDALTYARRKKRFASHDRPNDSQYDDQRAVEAAVVFRVG